MKTNENKEEKEDNMLHRCVSEMLVLASRRGVLTKYPLSKDLRFLVVFSVVEDTCMSENRREHHIFARLRAECNRFTT